MKAIIITRVSTDEQKENSPEAQLFRVKSYCQNREYEIIKEFNFVESAYKSKRDEFDKILEYITESKEKIAVCFDKVDRLSRNIFDKRVALLYEKAINNDIELHFVSDGQVINDKMNAGDKFAFGMKLGLSKYYSDAISDNVKRVFEQKRRNGEWTGVARLGYLNIPLDPEKRLRKDIVIDTDRGHLITKMFELYATGNYSLETIRKEVTLLGLRSLKDNELSKSNVENILNDSFYAGIAYSKKYNQTWQHKYPRLISKVLFDRCQDIREGRNKKRNKLDSVEYIFSGLLTCKHCDHTLSPERHKKNGKEFVYYVCVNSNGACKRYYINEKKLLAPIYDILNSFESISEDIQNRVVQELRNTTEAEITFHKAQISRIRTEYEQLKQKDNRLLEMYLDGSKSITKDIYDTKHQEYADKLQILNIQLEEYTKADYDYQTTVATVFSLARRAKQIFESSETHEKRALLNFLLQNPKVDKENIEFTLRSPFNHILSLPNNPTWLRRQGSNLRPIA